MDKRSLFYTKEGVGRLVRMGGTEIFIVSYTFVDIAFDNIFILKKVIIK